MEAVSPDEIIPLGRSGHLRRREKRRRGRRRKRGWDLRRQGEEAER